MSKQFGKITALGAAAGFGYGTLVGTIGAANGALQIATYPLYMSYCAVAPFIRLATPLWSIPALTGMGAFAGAVAEGYVVSQELTKDQQEVVDSLSAEQESFEYRINDLEEKVA